MTLDQGPFVSILLPVYNGEKYIFETIQSVLIQSYKNFELLIINDASTDNTEKEVLKFNDTRIRYIKNTENLQLISTLNKGISLCKGKYLARIDADDICLFERIKTQVSYMESHPHIAMVSTDIFFINQNGKITGRGIISSNDPVVKKWELMRRSPFYHPSIMVNLSLLKNNFSYDKQFLHAEDYALWLKLSHDFELGFIALPLLKYRLHSHNISNIHNKKAISSMINALNKFSIFPENLSNRENIIRLIRFPKQINSKEDYNMVLESWKNLVYIFCKKYKLDLIQQKSIRRNAVSYIFILTFYYIKNKKQIPGIIFLKILRQIEFMPLDLYYIFRDYCINIYRIFIIKYLPSFFYK